MREYHRPIIYAMVNKSYETSTGKFVAADDYDLLARTKALVVMHKT